MSTADQAGEYQIGDPEQLQAIEAGAAFRSNVERHGAFEIGQVRRQREAWQREATRALATGRTGEALEAYSGHGQVHAAPTRELARAELIERWNRERTADPVASRIILTHTNDEVRALNEAARERMRQAGELGSDVAIHTDGGGRTFAAGDRIMFLRNERGLGVKNGTLAILEQAMPQQITARLDDGRQVAFDLKDYAHIDHGYAATIHKAQGMTVDRTHVLATAGLDRHGTYVALSRHRASLELHYGQDDFATPAQLARTLGRDRAKDMAADYREEPEYGRAFADRRALSGEIRNRIEEGWKRFKAAVISHARAVSAIFRDQEQGLHITPGQAQVLQAARRTLDESRPHGAHDAECAYKAYPELAHEAAGGRIARAVRALQLEAELRQSTPGRADAFIERWSALGRQHHLAYQRGDLEAFKRIKADMGAMARSLERDPQLESLLAGRKQALGIGHLAGDSIRRDLAISMGIDLGRGRGLGI